MDNVRKLEAKWGYGFDEEWHKWEEIIAMYPDCMIWCVQTVRGENFYPPKGAKVYKWLKLEWLEEEPEYFDDITKLRRMDNNKRIPTKTIFYTNQTEEEYFAVVDRYKGGYLW